MVTLRELIADAGDEDQPAWLYADRYATGRLGAPLARLIRWEEQVRDDGLLYGVLASDDASIVLRYEPESEPGNDRVCAQVPCPDRPGCPGPAWDTITGRHELLLALDAGIVDDPWCERDGDR